MWPTERLVVRPRCGRLMISGRRTTIDWRSCNRLPQSRQYGLRGVSYQCHQAYTGWRRVASLSASWARPFFTTRSYPCTSGVRCGRQLVGARPLPVAVATAGLTGYAEGSLPAGRILEWPPSKPGVGIRTQPKVANRQTWRVPPPARSRGP